MGTDRTAYRKLDIDEPSGDLKVVRFFDLWDVKPGKTYTYRFRIWADDPNHESADGGARPGAAGQRGGRGRSGRDGRDAGGISSTGSGDSGGSVGLSDDGGGAPPAGAGRGANPRGGASTGGRGSRDDEDQPVLYKKVPIPDAQKHISVRNRIDAVSYTHLTLPTICSV